MNSCGARRMMRCARRGDNPCSRTPLRCRRRRQPRIGDRGAMGVAGEIGEHARGSAERRLGVDDERALPKRAHAGEGVGFGERGQFAEEAEFALLGMRL